MSGTPQLPYPDFQHRSRNGRAGKPLGRGTQSRLKVENYHDGNNDRQAGGSL